MKKELSTLLFAGSFLVAGCATTEPGAGSSMKSPSPEFRSQFACLDRSGDDFITVGELRYLDQCGIGDDLKCGEVPTNHDGQKTADDVEKGLEMIRTVDVNNNDRISRLEFQAYCNGAGRSD